MTELQAPPEIAAQAFERRKSFVRYLKEGPPPRVRVLRGREGEHPRLSIIIPTAGENRSGLLTQLLGQLGAQTEQRFEVILVQGDRRQGRAINTGAAIARGEVLVTMDDDTRIGHPELLERILRAFETDPTLGIVAWRTSLRPMRPG